jgi:hypothetical protein
VYGIDDLTTMDAGPHSRMWINPYLADRAENITTRSNAIAIRRFIGSPFLQQ